VPHKTSQHASTPKRRTGLGRRFFAKFVTLSAMTGAAALMLGMALPASGLHSNAALADQLTSVKQPALKAQQLSVPQAVVAAAPARDAYTVVLPQQKVRTASVKGSFAYSNNVAGSIQWPFAVQVPISSGFGPRSAPCGGCSSMHEGVDFIPGAGVQIHAIADGVVSLVETGGAYGYHVVIDHVVNGQKVQSLYAHMRAGSIAVALGQVVKVTDVVGEVGSTGEATGAHLHLEIHLNGVPVNPFAWLKANAN
jgi:murein DD-endopeptidase MepM/ murein hydrolase activator NlpD